MNGLVVTGSFSSLILLISVSFHLLTSIAPVCTTELGEFARREAEFKRRNVKLLGISINELKDHHTWIRDINEIHSCNLSYPIIADNDFKVAQAYGMIDQATESKELPYTVRSLFFIDPSKKVRAIISYPASTGRNVNEVIRVLDSLQLCDKQKVATPANWTPGKEGLVLSN